MPLFSLLFSDVEDSRESVNDTCLKAWNSMPPYRPEALSVYLGKITRQLSIDMFRKRNRKKRQVSEYALSLSELDECVSGGDVTGQDVELHLLAEGSYITTVPGEMLELPDTCGDGGEEEKADGLKSFGMYYVPAVKSEYLTDMPAWDGSFN